MSLLLLMLAAAGSVCSAQSSNFTTEEDVSLEACDLVDSCQYQSSSSFDLQEWTVEAGESLVLRIAKPSGYSVSSLSQLRFLVNSLARPSHSSSTLRFSFHQRDLSSTWCSRSFSCSNASLASSCAAPLGSHVASLAACLTNDAGPWLVELRNPGTRALSTRLELELTRALLCPLRSAGDCTDSGARGGPSPGLALLIALSLLSSALR